MRERWGCCEGWMGGGGLKGRNRQGASAPDERIEEKGGGVEMGRS